MDETYKSRGRRRSANLVEDSSSEFTEKNVTRIQEKESPVRIRSGAGIDYTHTGKYLGKGIHEVDVIVTGAGSKSGWGHLVNDDGWVALDFVEILK